MQIKNKRVWLVVIFVFLIGSLFFIRFFLGGDEDTWLCENGQWVKHGQPHSQTPEPNECTK
ncbi:MAG TPA: hypothetical protein VMW29_00200 [Candidatus Bathyarchaeia archaeon]|nr:hypothetical protein [Candidatus Bathyarchaeia archaeon]